MSSFLAVHDMMNRRRFERQLDTLPSQGFSKAHIKTARGTWTRLAESTVIRDLPGRAFATKSPSSAGWRMLCDWFLPITIAQQVMWSVAFDAAKTWRRENSPFLFLFLFIVSLLLSSFWTSCGLRHRPFRPVRAFSFFMAHRVQHSHFSSTVIQCCQLTLSRFPQVNLCTRKSPYEFIRVCTRGDSNSRN